MRGPQPTRGGRWQRFKSARRRVLEMRKPRLQTQLEQRIGQCLLFQPNLEKEEAGQTEKEQHKVTGTDELQ